MPLSAARALSGWDVAATSLPRGREGYTAGEVLTLRRLRWQVVVSFNWCKGHGGLDRVAGRPERVPAEMHTSAGAGGAGGG